MKQSLVVATLLALLLPAAVVAKEELTLEGLADEVTALAEKLSDVIARVETIESIWVGPGSTEMADDVCLFSERGTMQDETVLKYREKFDRWLDLNFSMIHQIRYSADTGHTLIVYADRHFASKLVIEEWNGCVIVGSSEWWEE